MKTLVQVLLPLYDEQGRAFPREAYDDLRRRLTERFGGLEARFRQDEILVRAQAVDVL